MNVTTRHTHVNWTVDRRQETPASGSGVPKTIADWVVLVVIFVLAPHGSIGELDDVVPGPALPTAIHEVMSLSVTRASDTPASSSAIPALSASFQPPIAQLDAALMLCRRDSQGTSPGRQLSLVVDLSKSDCGPADARTLGAGSAAFRHGGVG